MKELSPNTPTIFYYKDAGRAAEHLASAAIMGYWVTTKMMMNDNGEAEFGVAVGGKA